jgi:hypothetical protein
MVFFQQEGEKGGGLGMYEKELAWLAKNYSEMEKYEGKWVAILNGKLVGVGDSPKEVIKKVKKKGIKDLPLLDLIPRKNKGIPII